MIYNKLIILIYFYLSNQITIKDGVYNIMNNNLYLFNNKINISFSESFHYPNTFFRIKKYKSFLNDNIYIIEEIEKNLLLGLSENNELILNKEINNSFLWKFIEVNKNNYAIENLNKCFLKIDNLNIKCDNNSLQYETNFQINKIYDEISEKDKKNKYYNKILNDEPIDILIKYIDLRDPYLKRDKIHQIEKDFDNEEIRYSIRSILKNIPWIRKIYILMPNDRVRYFKEDNSIHNKIIYVKDKDILGYDSSNCNAFIYRFWKIKKFGISDNIIIMDDDFFIGNKLDKSDFFYVKKGKVVPLITTSNFIKINKEEVIKKRDIYSKKAKASKEEQNHEIFVHVKFLTYNFLFDTLNKSLNESLFIPYYTHNAIPINLNDAKEVFDLVNNSKFRYNTLDCIYRHPEFIHFQIFITSYTFNKKNIKVNNIPSKVIDLNNSISSNYKFSLFCINKGAGNYPILNLLKTKIFMEYLFPVSTKYEKDNNIIYNLSFNVVSSMDKKEKEFQKQISKMITKSKCLSLIINQFLFFILIILKLILLVYEKYNY